MRNLIVCTTWNNPKQKMYLTTMLLYDNNTDLFLCCRWGRLRYMMYVFGTSDVHLNYTMTEYEEKKRMGGFGLGKCFKKNIVCTICIIYMISAESSAKAFLIRINKMYITGPPQVYVFRIMYLMYMCCVFPPINFPIKWWTVYGIHYNVLMVLCLTI